MRALTLPLLALTAALLCGGAADKVSTTPDAKADTKKDAPPACMHCGATCGLEPVCICEPGTKKQPKHEFATTCEPICIPGCGSVPWQDSPPPGCTGCCDDAGSCRSRMRYCKRLTKETVDEEKAVIERKVAYVCGPCRGDGPAGCCGVESPRAGWSWWPGLPRWWPRPTGQ